METVIRFDLFDLAHRDLVLVLRLRYCLRLLALSAASCDRRDNHTICINYPRLQKSVEAEEEEEGRVGRELLIMYT